MSPQSRGPSSEASARHAFVSGRVQGVGFPWWTKHEADALDLAGWVRNLVDGRVEVWFEGRRESVERLAMWLEVGPQEAIVEHLELREVEPQGRSGFRVTRPGLGDIGGG